MRGRARPAGAARTLSRGWSRDARRWTWATTAVLAATLTVLLATAGVLDGTTRRAFDQVADFYTGDLRVTPSRPGAIPGGWFRLDATAAGPGAADEMRAAGAEVAARVEAQFVLSRRGFADAYANEREGVPVGVPGSGADPRKVVTLGALVGILPGDPGRARLAAHIEAGRLPQPSSDAGVIEVAMAASTLEHFLAPEERAVPEPLLAKAGALYFDVTSAQLDPRSDGRAVLHRQARVVGLFDTGVDVLDAFTLLAPAEEVRYLLGVGRDEPVANVLLVQRDAGAAAAVAARRGWATEDAPAFAHAFVGQMVEVLQAFAWLVAALLFVLPTALVGHGLARQLASQQRELAVATAIGVPRRTLADALALQVLGMAGWAVLAAAAATALLAVLVPWLGPRVSAPLPLGFALTGRALGVAAAVTSLSVAVGLWVGLRSRARLPLAAALRAA